MKKILLITTIGFATIAAAPADSKGQVAAAADTNASANQASDVSSAAKSAPAAEEKKICKLLPETGSRMAKRACLTKDEWKKVEEATGVAI